MPQSWNEILNEILKKFSADMGAIHRYNPQDNYLYMIAYSDNIPPKIVGMIKRTELVGMVGETAKSKSHVTTHDLENAPPESAGPMAASTGVRGMLSVPILLPNGELVGTLGIGSFKEHKYSDAEIKELTKIASSYAEQLKTEKW